ncbi:MAG: 6-carboxytetrahydropterin synthase [Planctomycetota bacterium]|nr:MAG: 6-carboxytetrahydropterin synthase [Planctomycetota bacterium]
MFEISVESVFSAAHAIRVAGAHEPLHGHDWRVRVTIAADRLDDDGLVCDFHLIERALGDVVGPLRNRPLNETPPFDRLNPTAEHVAWHIGRRLIEALADALPAHTRLGAVEVTEAPGCAAVFRPDRPEQGAPA